MNRKNQKKIIIGKVVNAVGIKGEIKVYSYAESHETYENLSTIYLRESEKTWIPFEIKSLRTKGNTEIIGLKEIKNRNEAEAVRGFDVAMAEEDLPELPEGTYYIRDMIGMEVISETGQLIGTLKDVDCNRPQRLYIVQTADKKEVLIPGVDEFILKIDMQNRKIVVKLIEGMIL